MTSIRTHDLELHGHRGARGHRPENTLAGFAYALACGVSALEMDVGLTRDGDVVVFHDYALGPHLVRRAGAWLREEIPLRSLSLAELAQFDVGRAQPGLGYAERFPAQLAADGEHVPSLAQVIELVRRAGNDRLQFNIEAKSTPEHPGLTAAPAEFAARLVDTVRAAGVAERSLLQSFDWRVVLAVRAIAPDIRTGFTAVGETWYDTLWRGRAQPSPWLAGHRIDDFGSVAQLVATLGGYAWMPYFGDVDAASLSEAQGLGLRVIAWTVNEPGDMRRLIELGIDGITTDYPDRLREVAASLGCALPPPTPVLP